jgi:predicted RNA binding protein YcfA (HicA-like mRNA interferase family)
VRGGHHCYVKPGRTDLLVIPIHGNIDLKTGLQHKLMKQAGLTEDDL